MILFFSSQSNTHAQGDINKNPVALMLVIVKIQKQLKCSLTGEWVDLLCHIHIMECYSLLK